MIIVIIRIIKKSMKRFFFATMMFLVEEEEYDAFAPTAKPACFFVLIARISGVRPPRNEGRRGALPMSELSSGFRHPRLATSNKK